MERATVLALALALVVAGCAGPFGGPAGTETASRVPDSPTTAADDRPAATSEPTPTATTAGTTTATPTPDVVVREGSLPVDEDRIFYRVTSMADRRVEPPVVTVRDIPRPSLFGRSPVYQMLGFTSTEFPENRSTGITYFNGEVVLDASDDPADVERALAHEYVHVVQFRSDMVDHPRTFEDGETTDVRMAWQTVVEGGAVWLTDAYIERHMPGARPQSAAFARLYENPGTPASRLSLAWYHFGYRYVDARVESPSNLERAYHPFPNSTEQVLHDATPVGEPPRELDADVETGENWTAQARADRKGELFVRVLLRTELGRDRAVRAAEGWGNDRWWLLGDDHGNPDSMVWVLRWDSAADADEFERAFGAYADQRRAEASGRFRVQRLTGDTVAVFVGPDAFVEAASATAAGDEITVSVGESDGD